jgi:hypothetical protein
MLNILIFTFIFLSPLEHHPYSAKDQVLSSKKSEVIVNKNYNIDILRKTDISFYDIPVSPPIRPPRVTNVDP